MPSLAQRLRDEPFELILSSGFFGFFAHTGVVHALEELQLRPTLVGGSSAGALVAGLWGAGIPASEIRDRLFRLSRQDFWDPDPLFFLRGGVLRGERFQTLLEAALGTRRSFEDCALPVRVVVFDLRARRTVALDSGELAPAIRASCCVPIMFQPARVNGRLYLDGGVADRPGLAAASPGARILYHHLPAHSPWRKLGPASQNRPPARERLHTLCEPSLPRLSPFHLDRGPRAFELARQMTLTTLRQLTAHG